MLERVCLLAQRMRLRVLHPFPQESWRLVRAFGLQVVAQLRVHVQRHKLGARANVLLPWVLELQIRNQAIDAVFAYFSAQVAVVYLVLVIDE